LTNFYIGLPFDIIYEKCCPTRALLKPGAIATVEFRR
jgi:hypothetical protein